MLPLGLRHSELDKFEKTLVGSHSIFVRVMVLDMDQKPLADLSALLLDGQVNVDATADVTRSLTLSFLDVRRTLDFDSESPSDGALYLNRMIRVVYSVKVTGLGWVDVPVFTGPVTKVDRTDDVVNVEAQGKESLALGAAWRPITFKKGARKTDVIRELLNERAGETKFDLPDLNERLAKDLSLGRTSSPWRVAQRLADSLDRQLFYDGRGVARLRRVPNNPAYRFRTGTGGSVTTPPQISYSTEGLANLVWVKGGTPKGQKKPVSAVARAPKAHPLSAERLGRNGVPRYLVEVVERGNLRSEAEARKVAQNRLTRSLLETVDVAFEALPIPHLEPLDLVRLTTDEFAQPFRLRQFSLPLVAGPSMSVGYTKRVSTRKRRSRKK